MAIQSLIGMGKRWWSSTEDSRPSYKISHLDMLVSMNTQDLKLLRILFVEHYTHPTDIKFDQTMYHICIKYTCTYLAQKI